MQVSQEAGKVVCYSHLFNNFTQCVVIHTVKVFCIVNEAEIFFSGIPLLCLLSNECWKFYLWFLCLFKTQVYIWKFLVHVLLNLSLKDFLA